jgi:oligoribonuclease NrnB/cAMP/cGMP phosphodiesterase (DHH superfamily)
MKYDIYFHNDFDGRAAAAIVLAFLRSRGDDIGHFTPVKYDVIPQWLDERFFEKHKLFKGRRNPAIIVDFPYHPAAAFWFDHHIRPFRKNGWEGKFTPDKCRRYDDSYRSACHLALDSLSKGFG